MKLAILLLIIAVAALLLKSRLLKLRPTPRPSGNVDRKNKLKKKKTPKGSTSPTNNPYHAVSIEFDLEACPKVQSISDKFFLANQAPPIPLPKCTSAACHCKYIHHKGRRHAVRRPQISLTTEAYASTGKLERRESTGRRETD
ncbi:MAG: hypothetical protein V7725_03800 [Porticoccus sp.]